jgi:beta-fructofuranosidase
VLHLRASWVWDFWLADDGERFHLFFLKASRALHDPDRRHLRASVGHAVSDDLRDWHEVADALVPDDAPAPDDQAVWTGSVVRAGDDDWRMFYTGVSRAEHGLVQRVLQARSADLVRWDRVPMAPVEPGPGYDADLDLAVWPDRAWRDPWVFRDGQTWHMLVTARAGDAEPHDRGVVGHATSPDLASWEVRPPLSEPGSGFGQLEVTQVAEVEGRWTLLFSCMTGELSAARRAAGARGGIWAVEADSPTGPFDVRAAYLLHDESLYVGRLVRDRAGAWQLMAFRNIDAAGVFEGAITDPMPVRRGADGRLTLA